jgi:uncharacterized membrane protein required for colicin V production
LESLNLNWLDIVIILVLALGAFMGYKRGLIVTVFNTLGVIAAIIVAKFITNPISAYLIEHTKLYDKILEKIMEKVGTLKPITMAAFKLADVENGTAAEILARSVMSVIVFLAAFLIALIALSFLKHTLKSIADKTPIGAIDKLAGMVIGFVMALIFIFVFFAITAPFSGVAANETALLDAIRTSRLAWYFYLYNPIIPWMENINSI